LEKNQIKFSIDNQKMIFNTLNNYYYNNDIDKDENYITELNFIIEITNNNIQIIIDSLKKFKYKFYPIINNKNYYLYTII
jgi:hypothetical protein